MRKITAAVKDIPSYLKGFSENNLTQVTDRHEMCRWFDGDWGSYWFLFKNPNNSMRMDIVHQRNGKTRFGIYYSRPVPGTEKKIFGDGCEGGGGMYIYTQYIPLNELIKLCTDNGINFKDPGFTYADPLYEKKNNKK